MKLISTILIVAFLATGCEKQLDCCCTCPKIKTDYPHRGWYHSIHGGYEFEQYPDLHFDPSRYGGGMRVKAGLFDIHPNTGEKWGVMLDEVRSNE